MLRKTKQWYRAFTLECQNCKKISDLVGLQYEFSLIGLFNLGYI